MILKILYFSRTVLYCEIFSLADRYMFQEVQGILVTAIPVLEFPQRTKIRKAASAPAGRRGERERDCPYLLLGGIKLNTKNTLIVCVPPGNRETRRNRELRGFRRNLHQRIWVLRKSRNDHIWPSFSSDYSQWAETKASQDRIPPNPILIRTDTEVIPQFLLCIF